jgi:hypothetical protein
MAEVCSSLRQIPGEVRVIVAGVGDAAMRSRPDVATWSAVEYLGHLRDLMAFHRFVIERAVAESRPTLQAVDPDTSVASGGYATAAVDDLVDQFARRVERLSTFIESLEPASFDRTVVTGTGEEIDVALVARSALHEGRHHCGDLRRLVGRR